jgi:hypothetical protein
MMLDMERAAALEILNLTAEPSDGSWRYSWPTGQLVRAARHALRPRVPCFDQADAAALAFVKLADAASDRFHLRLERTRVHTDSRETRRV